MKTLKVVSIVFGFASSITGALFADWDGQVNIVAMTAWTFPNEIAAPSQSYMSVPPGSSLILTTLPALSAPGDETAYQWSKDGVAIPGATAAFLQLSAITADESGHYTVTATPDSSLVLNYVGIHLSVVPLGHLGNTSSRLTLKAGNDIQIFGFVVSGHEPKGMLVRVVGPTLGVLGVPTPAAQPRLMLYDAQGHVFGTTPTTSADWSELFQRTGAFALTGGENPDQTCSFQTFPPGTYTVHVSDAAAQGGNVLVEVYELP